MAAIICNVCNKEFDSDGSFHKHLKLHKMNQTFYYQTYYPRRDRFDGSMIRYKNKDYYFTAEFNSRANFKKWLDMVSPEAAKAYVIDFLKKRIEKKKLFLSPTQVELKTLMLPGKRFINEKLGGYNKICEELGLKQRFKKDELDESAFKDVSKKFIFTDSREQKALEFDNRTRIKGLSFGDYRMVGSTISIERKSLSDAWGTFTGGHERFEREIIRAKDAGAYLIILVESPFASLEDFPNQRIVYGKIKIPVEFVYHNIREMLQKYEHIQFLFVKDREEASRIIQKIFAADEQVKQVDLQLLYDMGKL